MCITFLFANPGTPSIKYKIILINNRDEFFARKTQKAALKEFTHTDRLSAISIYGLDLAGAAKEGTWLGISVDRSSKSIKIGNLANVTGEVNSGKQGRGPIVTNFINGTDNIDTYNNNLKATCKEFSSFNFLSAEISNGETQLYYVSNVPEKIQTLPHGFIGLGNSPMSSPFQKVVIGTSEFEKIINESQENSKDILVEKLFEFLQSEKKYFPDDELTKRRQDVAEKFSSIKVDLSDEGYGTRTHTIILVDECGRIDYYEKTLVSFEEKAGEWETTHLTIQENYLGHI